MASSSVLLEREFQMSRDGRVYNVKALALFLVHQYPEAGKWHISFDVETTNPAVYQSDRRLVSRGTAQKEAENAFDSGEVARVIESNLQSWIIIGAVRPVGS
jgi:hypothetical protein